MVRLLVLVSEQTDCLKRYCITLFLQTCRIGMVSWFLSSLPSTKHGKRVCKKYMVRNCGRYPKTPFIVKLPDKLAFGKGAHILECHERIGFCIVQEPWLHNVHHMGHQQTLQQSLSSVWLRGWLTSQQMHMFHATYNNRRAVEIDTTPFQHAYKLMDFTTP